MDKNIPGISFYDFLNKLIPGYLIYNCFFKYPFAFRDYVDVWMPESLSWMFVIMASFVLGIVYEWILRGVNGFLFCVISRFRHDDEDDCHWCFMNALCCLFGTNDEWSIKIGYRRVYNQFRYSPVNGANEDSYYAAYYNIERNGCLGNIPILEALSRFCKQIVIPAIIWELLYLDLSGCQSCFAVFVNIIAVIVLCSVSISLQRKICELVWEGDKYLNQGNSSGAPLPSAQVKIHNARISINSSAKSTINTTDSSVVDSININN